MHSSYRNTPIHMLVSIILNKPKTYTISGKSAMMARRVILVFWFFSGEKKRLREGDICWTWSCKPLFVKWMDMREVTMCSTVHQAYRGQTVRRWRRLECGRSSPYQFQTALWTTVHYSGNMGGEDLSDVLIRIYNILHKTMKWYKMVFFFVFFYFTTLWTSL